MPTSANPGVFQLVSDFEPTGDQPPSIAALVEALRSGRLVPSMFIAAGRNG